jgi:hypothetical protein
MRQVNCHSEANAEESAFSLSLFRVSLLSGFRDLRKSRFLTTFEMTRVDVRNDIVCVAGTEAGNYNHSRRVSCYGFLKALTGKRQCDILSQGLFHEKTGRYI